MPQAVEVPNGVAIAEFGTAPCVAFPDMEHLVHGGAACGQCRNLLKIVWGGAWGCNYYILTCGDMAHNTILKIERKTKQQINSKGVRTMENETVLALPDEAQFVRDITAINRFQAVVHKNMIKGSDYGVIPGTTKPTLLKPGAEKIAKLLGLADTYQIINEKEDWDRPLFRYMVKCILVSISTGVVISEGLGECNSMESKYRWRESKRKCPHCGAEAIIKGKKEYGGGWLCFTKQGGCGAKFQDGDDSIEAQKIERVENDDIYSQVNTILKMAKKRALVDASLSAGRLSEVFTQDIEDFKPTQEAPPAEAKGKPKGKAEGPPAPATGATAPITDGTLLVPPTNYGELKAIAHARQPEIKLAELDAWIAKTVGMDAAGITADITAAFNELKTLCGWEPLQD